VEEFSGEPSVAEGITGESNGELATGDTETEINGDEEREGMLAVATGGSSVK